MTDAARPRHHLVIGASGFLGAHVVRRLAAAGHPVRALLRTTSSTRGLEGIEELAGPVEVVHGDVHDAASIRAAMAGIDVVHFCVVDARPWLRDPAPLYRTNVDGLRTVLDVAREHDLHRFVHTSSIGTLPIGEHPVTEDDGPHNWLHRTGHYIASRVAGEELALGYAREHGVPVVALCVANTYGPGDHLPTPHGGFLKAAVRGRSRFFVRGAAAEVVDVRDAAQAFLLAAERGRVGARYIVSAGWMSTEEILRIGAEHVGVPAPRWGIPLPVLSAAGAAGEVVARVRDQDSRLTRETVRLMHVMTPLDHSRALAELGWRPRPVEETVRDAADFFLVRRSRPVAAD
ncbi:NAD-dependent epimerase/dehydratase family protein [Nocardioides sp. zg-ZUI104]|uniref:NAD-dependent epimerase/dehydratase family protein n=1 Tax=Nocardioides faecalis TaxID=2803858 RepID=UPI001BD16099|nr:NAD-dependent epimerase/dehydratase family protein [Nocardioides faecalis]MBS4754527.1 NAD-dependent epimerase/dehydratase family protein [Nocardioides faecalis]